MVITNSGKVITDSGKVITDSDQRSKVITFRPEWMITFDQNG
jgi:hypothetical protein